MVLVASAGAMRALPPMRTRLILGIAASILLHAALMFGLHPAGEPAREGKALLRAALMPAATPAGHEGHQLDPANAAPTVESIHPASGRETTPPDIPQTALSETVTSRPAWMDVPLSAPRYYTTAELDQRPEPISAIEPQAPPEAGNREGSVVLRLLIDERGHVDDAMAVRAEPPDLFEQAAVATFGRVRFSPGMIRGTPVKSQLLLEVQFSNAGRVASGRGY